MIIFICLRQFLFFVTIGITLILTILISDEKGVFFLVTAVKKVGEWPPRTTPLNSEKCWEKKRLRFAKKQKKTNIIQPFLFLSLHFLTILTLQLLAQLQRESVTLVEGSCRLIVSKTYYIEHFLFSDNYLPCFLQDNFEEIPNAQPGAVKRFLKAL